MAIPSSLYNTDTIATYGTTEIELTKKIEDLYPTAEGTVDNSIAYTKYDASWLYTAGVTCYPYEDGGTSVKFAEYEPDSSYCYKYYNWESDVPLTDANVNVCIITPGSTAGYYYINSESIIDYDINVSRFVRNAQTNKMLFTAQARRINLTELEPYEIQRGSASHIFPLQTVDLKYIDSHPDEYFYDFSLTGCRVWDGSDWIAASYVPAYISTSSSSQGIATINTCFNRRGIYYDMDVRQDSELYIHEDGSSDGFEANGATGWSLGWSEDVEVAPYYIGIGDMANLNALIEAEIEGEETRIDIITCQRAIPVNEIWYYFTWCSGVYYNHPDGVRNASHSSYYCPCIKGSTLSKLIAGCGLYFLADTEADLTGITPNTLGNCADIWLGEMSGDFTTTGNWIKGANINTYTGANREGNVYNGGFDPNYVPQPPSPEDGDDMDIMNTGATGSSGGFTHFYILSPQDLIDLLSDFYTHADAGESLSNNLVCSYILGIPSSDWAATEDVPVAIHNSAQGTPFVSVDDYKHVTATNNMLVTGTFDVPRRTNTFYDFSPYTTYEVFIPCCGWVRLPDTVAGRTINVYLYLDIASCCVKGQVMISGAGVCAVVNGALGSPIPMAVIESGILRGNNIQAGMGMIGGAIQTGVSAGSGNAMGIGLGAERILTGLVNCSVAGNTNYTEQKGGTGDITQFAMGHQCYIKITHPVIDPVVNEYIFAHTVGYLCNTVGQLSNFHGFTMCSNPHVHISATSTEKEEIKRLLEEGVILP